MYNRAVGRQLYDRQLGCATSCVDELDFVDAYAEVFPGRVPDPSHRNSRGASGVPCSTSWSTRACCCAARQRNQKDKTRDERVGFPAPPAV